MRADEPLELLQLAAVTDQQVLGYQVELIKLFDGLAGVSYHPGIHQIQRGQVSLHRVTAHRVVVPCAVFENCPGRALRRPSECGDAFGHRVRIPPDELDLRIEHLVHSNEVGPHNIPMHVLEGQMQIVVRTQLALQEIGDLAALGVGQAGDGEFGHQLLLGCVGSTQRLPVADRTKLRTPSTGTMHNRTQKRVRAPPESVYPE
ncbi:Uncharacterised protein [Mycobacteroides abscessus subsp. abscessus]|nr:Uncharacterised protein [Mycobacteroides abscessus subsp. abscessus]